MIRKITVNNCIGLYLLLLLISISTNAMTNSLSNKEATGHGMGYSKLAELRLYSLIIENGNQPTKQHTITQGISIPNTPTVSPCTSQIIASAGSSISATVSGNNTSSGYTTQFVLLDNANVIVSGPQATGTFIASTVGQFKIVAVNYSGILTGLSAGQNIQNIMGGCYEISAPKCFDVQASSCTSSTSVVIGNPLTATSTGNNTSVGYTTQYVLTDASDIVIMGPSNTSSFTPTMMGSYRIYAYNYSGTVSTVSAGTNFQTGLTGSCLSKSLPKCFVVVGTPDLTTTVGQPSPSPVAGQPSLIPVTVANIGTAPSVGTITEVVQIPAGTTFGTFPTSNNGWVCTTSGTTATCTNSAVIANGSNSTFSVPFIPTASQVGTPLTVPAAVVGGGGELPANTNNNSSTPVTTPLVVGSPNLTIIKSGPLTATIATNFTYTLTISNGGNIPSIGGIIVEDNLPTGIAFLTGSGSGWSCSSIAQLVTCTSTTPIASGSNSVITLIVTPIASGAFSNTATVRGGGDANTTAKNSNTVNTTVGGSVGLVSVKVFLQGPFNPNTGLMDDALRAQSLIPLTQPYSILSDFTYAGTESTSASVLSTTGNNAIVDWVMVELHSSLNPSTIISRRAALIQRDGDIVDTDGISAVTFSGLVGGNYYVAVRHRNHLGVMTATPVTISSTPALVNFTTISTANYNVTSPYAQYTFTNGTSTGVRTMWAGNASGDSNVIFQGPNSDIDYVFNNIYFAPGNTAGDANYIRTNYLRTDFNLDGNTIYQGSYSDTDIVFFNVLYYYLGNPVQFPNAIITQQIP